MKNYYKYSFYLTLTIVIGLLALYFLPTITIDGVELRQVDILADIREPKESDDDVEETTIVEVEKPPFIDECKEGMTCIEDSSDSTNRGMRPFYDALSNIKKMNRPVRIAHYGDSYIEGDILTADLRSNLQIEFGGTGVGYVNMTSEIYAFRRSVGHSFGGWDSHSFTDASNFDRSKQDISGFYAHPVGAAHITLSGKQFLPHLDTCEVSTIYFKSKDILQLTSNINNTTIEQHLSKGSGQIESVSTSGKIGKVQWNIQGSSHAFFYGVAMEGKRG